MQRPPIIMQPRKVHNTGELEIVTNKGTRFSPSLSPASPGNRTSLTPRQPVVHFFVCDYGNAKVKAFADQFVNALIQNGINVFTELYMTHQPGYQVRAASFNTNADFFFQTHSKTAGASRIRLYVNGQMQRMSINEAIINIWTTWKLKCGVLTQEEIEILPQKHLETILKEFANLSIDEIPIAQVQKNLKECIMHEQSVSDCIQSLNEINSMLEAGKKSIEQARNIITQFTDEPGTILSICNQLPVVRGLSKPLKDVLISLINQTQDKVSNLLEIARNHIVIEEVEIDIDQTPSLSNWGLMMESIDDGQQQASPYENGNESLGFMSMAPHFILNDF